ncbi:MAG: hypothetical protein HY378_00820 [Candidatus Brennerbacteria bacterium]|nr:hypothetical protein [Candidatus Brennerbacteria bacterium]
MDTAQQINIQKLQSFGGLLRGAWHSYVERFRVLVGIFVVPAVIILTASLIFLIPGAASKAIGFLLVAVGIVTSFVASLALVYSVFNNAGIGDSYRFGFKNFFSFLWIVILVSLAVLGGFIMLIVPGLIFSIAFSFSVFVFVTEGARGIETLARSAGYVKGYWWPVFWRFLGLGVITSIIALVIGLPSVLLGEAASNIVSFVVNLFVVPFEIMYVCLLYRGLVEIKGGPLAVADPNKKRKLYITSAVVGLVVLMAFLIVTLLIGSLFFRSSLQEAPAGFDFDYQFEQQ